MKTSKYEWYLMNYTNLDFDDCAKFDMYGDITKLQNEWSVTITGEDLYVCLGFADKQGIEIGLSNFIDGGGGINWNITVYHFGKPVYWKISIFENIDF